MAKTDRAQKEKPSLPEKARAVIAEKPSRKYGPQGFRKPQINLTAQVRWPQVVRVQRQRALLQSRLKMPPMVNQFHNPVSPNLRNEILAFARKYQTESRADYRKRIAEAAQAKAENREPPKTERPICVKYGLRQVTNLIEQKKAKLVVLASDVDPLEVC